MAKDLSFARGSGLKTVLFIYPKVKERNNVYLGMKNVNIEETKYAQTNMIKYFRTGISIRGYVLIRGFGPNF